MNNINTCMFCQNNLKIHHVTSEMKVLDDEKYTLEAYLNIYGVWR